MSLNNNPSGGGRTDPGHRIRIMRRILVVSVCLAAIPAFAWRGKLALALDVLQESGPIVVLKKIIGLPSIPWNVELGPLPQIDSLALAQLMATLAEQDSDALLVAKNGHMVVEWYADGVNPDDPRSLAAAAKAVVALPILLSTVDDGLFQLTDSAHHQILEWAGDSLKSKILIHQLASHTSGLDDVDFTDDNVGWRRRYFEDRPARLSMAVSEVPVLFAPGARQKYSGVAYYPLAYILSAVVVAEGYTDIASYLRSRLLDPLDIPQDALILSYGESYDYRGTPVVALGSGASMAPRAMLRIGQLLVDRGISVGDTLLRPEVVEELFGYAPAEAGLRLAEPPWGAALGWWTNRDAVFPSLPRDALVGFGNGDNLIAIVPSLRLVVVRLGDHLLADNLWSRDLDSVIFAPLMSSFSAAQ